MLIRVIRHSFVTESLLALLLGTIVSAQQSQTQTGPPQAIGETLIIGMTTLKLGMAREYVVGALSREYDLVSVPDATASGGYTVRAGSKPDADYVGEVYFDKKGSLEHAVKHWTPNLKRHYSDGEIGRVLFRLIGTLPNGACSFITVQNKSAEFNGMPAGKFQWRNAYIECGHKRFGFKTTTQDGDDSLDITEEIDAQGTLQRENVSPSELRPLLPR